MEISKSEYQKLLNLLFSNLIISILLFFIAFFAVTILILTRIQKLRIELRKLKNGAKIFPDRHILVEKETIIDPISIHKPCPSTTSILTKGTNEILTAKAHLDKKIFAAAASSMKNSSGGLKDLI